MGTFAKKLLNFFHPLLRPLAHAYLAGERVYSRQGITVRISPGVFHPGFFFSTRVLSDYLQKQDLRNRKVLELGAGSGYLSIFCAQKGARITATDINPQALKNCVDNARRNNVAVNVVESDLFDRVHADEFDLIIINPPYYPKTVKDSRDMAWYCGENFEYFEKLSTQLSEKRKAATQVIMILSEDCDLKTIGGIFNSRRLHLKEISAVQKLGEWNYIFEIRNE
jgi:release factor glutamine methyltransferase